MFGVPDGWIRGKWRRCFKGVCVMKPPLMVRNDGRVCSQLLGSGHELVRKTSSDVLSTSVIQY